MRILGLDYGAVTVGVAIIDELMLTAQPLETIRRAGENKLRRTLARIEELSAEYKIEKIVLGLPRNMDDTLGERAQRTLEFKEQLERRIGLPVVLWDERLSTWEASNALDATGFTKDRVKRKEVIDQIAAQIILEGYLAYIESGGTDDKLSAPAT